MFVGFASDGDHTALFDSGNYAVRVRSDHARIIDCVFVLRQRNFVNKVIIQRLACIQFREEPLDCRALFRQLVDGSVNKIQDGFILSVL